MFRKTSLASSFLDLLIKRGTLLTGLIPLTLTFKLARARDQTRLPCEFGVNLFSGSRDISYINKKVKDSAKNRTLRSSLRAVIINRKTGKLTFKVTFGGQTRVNNDR